MKKIASVSLAIILLISIILAITSQNKSTIPFNKVQNLNVDDVYGVSMFPFLQEQKNDDLSAIRKFATELLSFNLIALNQKDKIQKIENPSGGVFIEFYDKDGNRINGFFMKDGYIEKSYIPIMSRTPFFTHRAEDVEGITNWLNNYISLWRTDGHSFDEYLPK